MWREHGREPMVAATEAQITRKLHGGRDDVSSIYYCLYTAWHIRDTQYMSVEERNRGRKEEQRRNRSRI